MKSQFGNGIKTALLFAGMWVLLLGIGGGLAVGTRNAALLWVFAGIGLVTTFVTYWFSDKMALSSMGAEPLSEMELPQVHAMVRELSAKAGQPMPRVYLAPTLTPNAFATGRNPQNAAVCVTEGIVQLLDDRELRGVIGHELMHVYNRDILTASVASAIGGLITSFAQFFLLFGAGKERQNQNPVVMFLMLLLAPIAATVIQLAISRTREFDADEDGAKLTEDPLALASALKKIQHGGDDYPLEPTPARENVSAMMIANPFRGASIAKLFSTHPPMEERVRRLEIIAGYHS